MRPLSQRLQLLRSRMSDSGRLAVTDSAILAQAISLAKRYEDSQGLNCDEDGFLFASFVPNRRVRIVPEGES